MRNEAILLLFLTPLAAQSVGYTDTPKLPDGWRVHDAERPRPRVVDPGPAPAKPQPAPADAIVLFDGNHLAAWQGSKGDAEWTVRDGYAEVNGTGDIRTKESFGDCQLHIEWATPAPAKGSSQGRGNSGVFLLGRYELQVLDSYENVTYADGQAAAMYGQIPPLVNACRRPGEWQTYDIVFHAPRFGDDGALLAPARITVLHNGVLVHDNDEYLGPTAHRTLPKYAPHPTSAPIRLQDHGDPVRYRNIWIRKLEPSDPSQPAKLSK
ncbi:MAG: DUF1080 domain-containing protein [Planctomycetes bacterium]|nr:DUF1080 domain-containing protein [Planctomycetota bacterium]